MQLARDAERFTVEQLQELFRMYAAAEDSLRVSAHPRFVLETAAVRATRLLRTAEVQPASSGLSVQHNKPAADRRVVTQTLAQSQDKATPAPAIKTAGAKVGQDTVAKTSAASGSGPKASSAARPREVEVSPARPPAVAPSAPAVVPASVAPVQQEPKATTVAEASAAGVEVNWEHFQEAVSTNHPNIAPFLEMGRLVKIEGWLITLGFAKQATTARSMLEKEDNLQALAALGESLYGCAVRIRIVEVAEQDPGAAPTMKQIRVAKEQEQRLILTQQAKAHPLVKQALEMFGGELAEVRTTAPAQEVQE
jgi:DNA polymerase-3 subunit gamma/tau